MFQIVFDLFDVAFQCVDFVLRFVAVEFRNTHDFDFGQTQNIFFSNRSFQRFDERFQAFVNRRKSRLLWWISSFNQTVNPVLDENAFQRKEMPLFFEFSKLNFKLAFEQLHRAFGGNLQHMRNAYEQWFVVFNDAT